MQGIKKRWKIMRTDSEYIGSEKLVCYDKLSEHRFPAENLNFLSVPKTLC